MTQILQHSPGQLCTLVLETMDGYARSDSYTVPQITRVLFPNLMSASGYPKLMTRIDTGLYTLSFTLPAPASSVGTYIADAYWQQHSTDGYSNLAYQIVVTAPYGVYGVSPG